MTVPPDACLVVNVGRPSETSDQERDSRGGTGTVALGERAEAGEGLLALVVGAGLKVMFDVILEHEDTAQAGGKGKSNSQRGALRHGSDGGQVSA